MNPYPRLDFGLLIAFFLPGFVTFFTLSYISSRISKLFQLLLTKDQAYGASFIILAGALTAGIIIGGIRALVIDRLHLSTGVSRGETDYGKLKDPGTLAAFNEAVNNTYRYYQFYGNMFIAILFLCLVRYVVVGVNISHQKFLFALSLVTVVALFVRSRESLQDTYDVVQEILGK